MRALGGLLVLLAGCDIVLGLDRNAANGDGGIDTPPDAPVSCGTPELHTDFASEAMMLLTFDRYEMEGTSAITDRALVLTSTVPFGYASIETNRRIDFANKVAQVKLVQPVMPPNAEAYFSIHGPDPAMRYFFSVDTSVEMAFKQSEAPPAAGEVKSLDYDATAHRYLRLEHRDSIGAIVFSTSVNGMMWTERFTIPLHFDIRDATIRIGAGTYSPGTDTTRTAIFDDFELCPVM